MKTIEVYTLVELKEINPKGYEEALSVLVDRENEMFDASDIFNSFEKLFQFANIKVNDYGIGDYRYFVRFEMDEDTKNLRGKRAFAWLENNLFNKLRIPFKGKERWELSKYGRFYRAGMIKPCPLTGMCYDEDFLNGLVDEVKKGSTLGEAFHSLARIASRLINQEYDYLTSEENLLDSSEANGYSFTKDGILVG